MKHPALFSALLLALLALTACGTPAATPPTEEEPAPSQETTLESLCGEDYPSYSHRS